MQRAVYLLSSDVIIYLFIYLFIYSFIQIWFFLFKAVQTWALYYYEGRIGLYRSLHG